MAEPLRINRPWLPEGQRRYEATCPTCKGVFEFLASEGARFVHKTRGECWKLNCPCCGHKLAKEVEAGTEIDVPKTVSPSDVSRPPKEPKVTKSVTSGPENSLF